MGASPQTPLNTFSVKVYKKKHISIFLFSILEMDFDTIIKEIKCERKQIIYIGVGTYAGLKEEDGSLLQKNYHQYPPFLQSLKNSQADTSLSILLIDPMQENPPYMVEDKGLVPKYKGLVLNYILPNNITNNLTDDIYTSPDHSLTVYTLRENVYTDPYQKYNDNYLNITEHLRDLNNYAIENNVLFIYHDFTGRNNRFLAEYFDEEIKAHLDHIIYGLGLREDFGCYFDLTDLSSYHPVYQTDQGALKLFNVYDYIVNDKINLMFNTPMLENTSTNTDIVNTHMQRLLVIVTQELNNIVLQALRVVFRLITGEDVKEFDKGATEYKYLSPEKRAICLNFCREKNYCDLYDFLLTEFGKKLDVVAYINKLDITGREILESITMGDDPFKWYDNVKNFLPITTF